LRKHGIKDKADDDQGQGKKADFISDRNKRLYSHSFFSLIDIGVSQTVPWVCTHNQLIIGIFQEIIGEPGFGTGAAERAISDILTRGWRYRLRPMVFFPICIDSFGHHCRQA
jgi:hypothetical protein